LRLTWLLSTWLRFTWLLFSWLLFAAANNDRDKHQDAD
jgi:hypothetical protein